MAESLPIESIVRGDMARAIMDNDVFHAAFIEIVDDITDAIADAPIDNAELRNQLGLQLGAAKVFKERLIDHIQTAKLDRQQQSVDAVENAPKVVPGEA